MEEKKTGKEYVVKKGVGTRKGKEEVAWRGRGRSVSVTSLVFLVKGPETRGGFGCSSGGRDGGE